jgi:hypothetical protein
MINHKVHYFRNTIKSSYKEVIEPNSGSDAEKFFDVGKRSARLRVPRRT